MHALIAGEGPRLFAWRQRSQEPGGFEGSACVPARPLLPLWSLFPLHATA